MKRLLSTALAVTLLLGLGALAVLARGGDILTLADNAVAAAAQPQTAAAPDAPAAGGKYNMLGVPLIVSSITDETSLATYIQNNTQNDTPITVGRILKWNPSLNTTGGYYSYIPGDEESDTFTIEEGDAFWLLSVGTAGTVVPPVLSYVGDVPDAHSVTFPLIGGTPCRYNMITVPLDKTSIANETDLANDIGTSNVARILYWDPTLNSGTGGYYSYIPGDEESDHFAVKIGYPYWVCMNTTMTWPVWP